MSVNIDRYIDEVLGYIAVCGEVRLVDMFVLQSSQRHVYRITKKLLLDKLIKQDNFQGDKTFRLTYKGKKYLKDKYPEKFSGLFEGNSETNKIRTEEDRRDRNLKLAQVKLMLGQAGVNLLCDNKPLIGNYSCSIRTDGTDGVDCDYHFYTSSELKKHLGSFKQKRNSRALGVLVSKNSICVFYNAGDRNIRWCEEDEKFFRTHVSTQINRTFYKDSKIIKTVMIVSSSDMPTKILQSDGGKRNTNLRVDRAVQNMHTFRYRTTDRIVLDLLIDKINYSEAVRRLIPELNLSRKSEMSQTILDEQGRKVLLAFDMDLKKIDAFCKQIGVYDKGNVIYCFDFQKKYIEGYLKNACIINTITEEEFRNAIE